MGFKFTDHTADVGVEAWGMTEQEALASLAEGMFSLITDLDSVEEREVHEIEITAQDHEELVVSWLNELIYRFEVDGVLFRRFEIMELGPGRLKARACGERIDRTRHPIKLGIKAATYHQLDIKRENGCRISVLLDI